MRSEYKLRLDFVLKENEKYWVKVVVLDGSNEFYPSFEDLWRILVGISWCEIRKYVHFVKDPTKKITKFLLYTMKEARELLLHQTSKESTLRAATKEEVEEAWQRLSMQAELPGRVRE